MLATIMLLGITSIVSPATALDTTREKELQASIAKLTNDIEENPQSADHYVIRGHAYRALGKYDLALKDYDQALKLGTKSSYVDECYEGRGTCYLKLNKLNEAMADFNKALKLDPGLFEARKGRAAALLRLGRPQETAAEITGMLAHHKRDSSLYLSRARALSAMRQYDRALADVKMAASVNKDDMYVPLEGARVYLALRQPQMALAYLNSDHKKCSGMGEYWALMSLSHYSLGQFQNTVNEANKAKDLGYQNADLLAAAADSSARLGHNDEAVSFATSAVGLNPNNAMALYVRGQCWKKLKRDDLAKEDLQKAASLGYAPK